MKTSTLTFSTPASSQQRHQFIKTLLETSTNTQKANPHNLCCKYLPSYLTSPEGQALSDPELAQFFQCVTSGILHPSSSVGCYATTAADYTRFRPFFDRVIRDYHHDPTALKKHVTNWNFQGAENLDVTALGVKNLSIRVRVGRNIEGFPLPGAMNKHQRIQLEMKMLALFKKLTEKHGGNVFSLSPDLGPYGENPNLVTNDQYKELVDAHLMFKDMSQDSYLKAAGIADDWPYGRGGWHSADRNNIIWYGEEDHVRIICMKSGNDLLEPFKGLRDLLSAMESIGEISFSKHDTYGYITSCPSNLGTAMRASVHIKVPKLTKDGSTKALKDVCEPLGLSVRGKGGEHTAIGEDGTVDISPSVRLFVSEGEIIGKLYEGVRKLMELENGLVEDLTRVESARKVTRALKSVGTEPEYHI